MGMVTWTDNQVQSNASVAATTETKIGNTINIPSNQNWNVRSLYWAHAGDGTGRVEIDNLPGMTGVYVVNSNDPGSLASGEGSTLAHDVNFNIIGPATLIAYTTPASSSSTLGIFAIKYQVTVTQKSVS